MKIEILCTGDEILTGKTVNTNYSHLARRLTEHGFQTYWGTTVGDDSDCLLTAFKQAAERADAVIVNGGLGPTVDDLTQEVAAQAANVQLELNHHWLGEIESWYHKNGRVMPVNNQKQAMLPVGSELIDNPVGTACGFALTINNARFFFTPGVPREFKLMIEEEILPRLQIMRGNTIYTQVKRFHSFGIGESRADRLLSDVENMATGRDVKLGFQSHFPQLETKLTISDTDQDTLKMKLEPLANAVREKLGNFVVAEDNETLEGVIIQALSKSDSLLAIAEVGTAGGVLSRLVEYSANEIVTRGYAASNYNQLCAMLNSINAVGEIKNQSTEESVLQLCESAQSSIGLVIHLEHDHKANESAKISIGVGNQSGVDVREGVLPGRIGWTKTAAIELALDCLRRYLLKLPVYERIDFEQH